MVPTHKELTVVHQRESDTEIHMINGVISDRNGSGLLGHSGHRSNT